jgi:type III restriction enzyme
VKVAAAHRWVQAVNADGSFGLWHYALSHNPNDITKMLDELDG